MSLPPPSRALVVGLGSSGVAAALLLADQGWQVKVNDRASTPDLGTPLAELAGRVTVAVGGHQDSLLESVALVVVSPGVAWELPLLVEARRRGIEVLAEVELAFRVAAGTPLLAITGSNGKTTTTALAGEMVRASGQKVGIGGNIGMPACALARESGWDALVWELSSFQLEGCSTLRPGVGVLLNLSPDHLDRHADFASYRSAKERLFAQQDTGDVAVLNADDPLVAALEVRSRVARFSLADRTADAHLDGATLILDGSPLVGREELRIPGDHNVANALAAALAAERFGVPRQVIAGVLRTFEPLAHRHQVVAEHGGIRWVDDSKGTNVGSVVAGLTGYRPGSIHLILGGLGKGQDFRELRPAVAARVAHVYLIGEASATIHAALVDSTTIEECGTLEQAVHRAATLARPGDAVLLSPACASFDQFRDYKHRGDEFARLARAATGGA